MCLPKTSEPSWGLRLRGGALHPVISHNFINFHAIFNTFTDIHTEKHTDLKPHQAAENAVWQEEVLRVKHGVLSPFEEAETRLNERFMTAHDEDTTSLLNQYTFGAVKSQQSEATAA